MPRPALHEQPGRANLADLGRAAVQAHAQAAVVGLAIEVINLEDCPAVSCCARAATERCRGWGSKTSDLSPRIPGRLARHSSHQARRGRAARRLAVVESSGEGAGAWLSRGPLCAPCNRCPTMGMAGRFLHLRPEAGGLSLARAEHALRCKPRYPCRAHNRPLCLVATRRRMCYDPPYKQLRLLRLRGLIDSATMPCRAVCGVVSAAQGHASTGPARAPCR